MILGTAVKAFGGEMYCRCKRCPMKMSFVIFKICLNRNEKQLIDNVPCYALDCAGICVSGYPPGLRVQTALSY